MSLTIQIIPSLSLPPSSVPLWRMKPSTNPRDAAADAARRLGQKKHGFPDILPIGQGEGKRVDLTREWQLYLMAIKPQMTTRDFSP